MNNEQSKRSKPQVRVAVIGRPVIVNKLMEAMRVVFPEELDSVRTVGEIDSELEEKARGITINTAHFEYETPEQCYVFQASEDVEVMGNRPGQADVAILVGALEQDPISPLRKAIRLLRLLEHPYIIVFLNKVDLVGDDDMWEEQIELMEMEVRNQLTTYGFPGDDTPIIKGSAAMALNGQDRDGMGKTAMLNLRKALEA